MDAPTPKEVFLRAEQKRTREEFDAVKQKKKDLEKAWVDEVEARHAAVEDKRATEARLARAQEYTVEQAQRIRDGENLCEASERAHASTEAARLELGMM